MLNFELDTDGVLKARTPDNKAVWYIEKTAGEKTYQLTRGINGDSIYGIKSVSDAKIIASAGEIMMNIKNIEEQL